MRINKFQVKGYRSCESTILLPNSGLTALIGVNGSGKSNLLSAILLLKKATNRSLWGYNKSGDGDNCANVKVEIDYNGSLIHLKGDIFYSTSNRNIDEVVRTELKWNLESITGERGWLGIPIELIMSNNEYGFFLSHGSRRLSYSDMLKKTWYGKFGMKNLLPEKLFPVLSDISKYLQNINYYSASQFADPSRCPVSLKLNADRPPELRSRDAIDHERFIYDLYCSSKDSGEAFLRYRYIAGTDGIGLVEDIIFDEIKLPSHAVEVRAGGKAVQKETSQLVVVPIFVINGRKLSPNQLSEGTFKTLALLYYVLTDDSSLLLVEEPEVCIHHGLLNSVITLIKQESRDKQIVISTHSDYVLDQLDPDNIVLVDRSVEGGTKARSISKAMSRSDYKALRQYLEESGNLGEYWREGGFDGD
jgi:ABC-type lipoprotein export system ATPase subunit